MFLSFSLKLKDGGIIEADLVMYATGRAPNTHGLGLEEAGQANADHSARWIGVDLIMCVHISLPPGRTHGSPDGSAGG